MNKPVHYSHAKLEIKVFPVLYLIETVAPTEKEQKLVIPATEMSLPEFPKNMLDRQKKKGHFSETRSER